MQNSLLIDIQTALVAFALIVPRTLVCIAILPGFSMRSLSGLARRSVALAIALPAALPTFYFVQETPPDVILITALAFKEAAIGCMLGVLLSIPVWSIQSIGSIFDVQRSPIQSQSNNPSIDQDASTVGGVLLQAVVLVMMQAGLFVALARILIESYGLWPAFTLAPPFEHGHFDVLLKRFGEFFWHIIVYGAPVVIPLLLVDLAFAFVGVFAPNLQVSFASSPIKCLVGLFILLLYWPTLSHYVAGDFARMLDLAGLLLQSGTK